MSGKGIREGLLERTAELLDLPADAVAGVPRLELVGTRELRMENHKASWPMGRRRSTSAEAPTSSRSRGRPWSCGP